MKYLVLLVLLGAQFTLAAPFPAADDSTSSVDVPNKDGGAATEGEVDVSKFGYEGSNGPALWPGFCRDLNPGQSPINIRPGNSVLNPGALPVTLSPQESATVSDVGHGLAITLSPNATDSSFVPVGQDGGAQTEYQLTGFHLHSPSEHHINGKYFDAEMHLVHKSPAGDVAVIGVMYEIGSESNSSTGIMEAIESVIPQIQPGTPVRLPPFDFDDLIQNTNNFTGFHTYKGSLTTPPCSPNVLWHVMDKPHPMTVKQALALRNSQGFTARYIQVAKDEIPVFGSEPGSLPKLLTAVDQAVTHMKTALGQVAAQGSDPVV